MKRAGESEDQSTGVFGGCEEQELTYPSGGDAGAAEARSETKTNERGAGASVDGETPVLPPPSTAVKEGIYQYLSEMRESHYVAAVRSSGRSMPRPKRRGGRWRP